MNVLRDALTLATLLAYPVVLRSRTTSRPTAYARGAGAT